MTVPPVQRLVEAAMGVLSAHYARTSYEGMAKRVEELALVVKDCAALDATPPQPATTPEGEKPLSDDAVDLLIEDAAVVSDTFVTDEGNGDQEDCWLRPAVEKIVRTAFAAGQSAGGARGTGGTKHE